VSLKEWSARAAAGVVFVLCPVWADAQSTLSVAQAVELALASRPVLKAEGERVAAAEGRVRQAGLWPNPEFQFSNENLRRGQSYATDVDTLAVFTQPLDVLGKREHRVTAAQATASRIAAEVDVARRDVARQVRVAYWTARGAQERRDLLRASIGNFQRIVDFHQARLSVGAIPEQDVLRVRLEQEQLQVAVHIATLDATTARVQLFREIGRPDDPRVVLSEPLDLERDVAAATTDAALAHRAELRVSKASLDEAAANLALQNANARPDLGLIVGFKRTSLPDAPTGVNTAIAGVRVTLPLIDRNQGNRLAAEAETRRQQQLFAETEVQIRADVDRARQEYELRRAEMSDTLKPLREHATELAGIARAAYEQGAVEVLRLLDAERARFEAERFWVEGMVAYQQSVANLEFAEGAVR
jgi:cobalt-zinc-cadmium efflux system outer membrane protein